MACRTARTQETNASARIAQARGALDYGVLYTRGVYLRTFDVTARQTALMAAMKQDAVS